MPLAFKTLDLINHEGQGFLQQPWHLFAQVNEDNSISLPAPICSHPMNALMQLLFTALLPVSTTSSKTSHPRKMLSVILLTTEWIACASGKIIMILIIINIIILIAIIIVVGIVMFRLPSVTKKLPTYILIFALSGLLPFPQLAVRCLYSGLMWKPCVDRSKQAQLIINRRTARVYLLLSYEETYK